MQADDTAPPDRLARVIADIDTANADDPTVEHDPQRDLGLPAALLYGQRMSARLERFAPGADELLHIAVRAQHIRRWTIPRRDFPEGRAGYHRWRQTLGRLHAETASRIMAAHGYGDDDIGRVQRWLRKENLKGDAGTQTLEDVACLVFLEHYLDAFVDGAGQRHDEAKLLDILRRTWRKMSPQGQCAALALDLSPRSRELIGRALENAAD